MSFLDNLFTTGPAVALKTPTSQIDVSSSAPALNRVLKVTSLDPLQATWEDSGGSVATVFGRSGDVVAAAGDYQSSEVDNDSAVTGASVTDALESLQNAIAAFGPAAPVPLPFVTPPGGWDTSFDFDAAVATDPDLAANGWTIALTHSPYTVLTRAGDVRWLDHVWAAAASGQTPGVTYNYPPAAGTYYSSLVGGRLLLQLPGGVDVSISRATTAVGGALFTAGVGGGSRDTNARALWLSNGLPGAANVSCGYVSDHFSPGATSVGGAMPGMGAAPLGIRAGHLALGAPVMLAVGDPPGRWLQPNWRPLFDASVGGVNTGALIDSGHSVSGRPATSLCGLRLMSGPATYITELASPLEVFYIRRLAHRLTPYF